MDAPSGENSSTVSERYPNIIFLLVRFLTEPPAWPTDYMTERPPSPPSLLIMLFVLHHSISASDELFLASLPRSLNILPVFTKTDLCPAQEIAERKRKLQNLISAAREAPIGGKQTAGEGGEGPAGKTWEGICVSVKKGWVFRDQVRAH